MVEIVNNDNHGTCQDQEWPLVIDREIATNMELDVEFGHIGLQPVVSLMI